MVRTMKAALDEVAITAAELSAVSANGSSSTFYDPLGPAAIGEFLLQRSNAVLSIAACSTAHT